DILHLLALVFFLVFFLLGGLLQFFLDAVDGAFDERLGLRLFHDRCPTVLLLAGGRAARPGSEPDPHGQRGHDSQDSDVRSHRFSSRGCTTDLRHEAGGPERAGPASVLREATRFAAVRATWAE